MTDTHRPDGQHGGHAERVAAACFVIGPALLVVAWLIGRSLP